jgi:putative membrane-bound dehydrogenase-like protein
MPRLLSAFVVLLSCLSNVIAHAADGNRLAYLDGPLDPYYPHRDFPKLITPQWVGDDGVECVVTLAIDDMRETGKYETFLRPILNRLKQIDGRAPVSIMSCRVNPAEEQLQQWLKEGLSIEVHTYDHPCPCLQDGGLVKAKETYDKCVDLMSQIPGNQPVAFRMPCCDSKNTPSPRFWTEVFNKTTEKGNFLQIDSSVFNIITNKDKELPKEITELADGSERFRRYVPFTNFVNTIEDYPYPYIIGGMCWEFPCVTPSDWSAQHVQKPNNPDTVRDWKLALDACVIKKGTFNLVFHPHGWIKAEQIIELIDHAVAKHGKKMKFLTFRECAERLNKNVLAGQLLRKGKDGFSVELMDSNGDGLLDVRFVGPLEPKKRSERTWNRETKRWEDKFTHRESFAIPQGLGLLQRDVDGDGKIDLVMPKSDEDDKPRGLIWQRRNVELPGPIGVTFSSLTQDYGLRLVDINSDGKLDCLFSNHERYLLYLFKDERSGWATKVFDVVRGKEDGSAPVIPPFVRSDGTNNGAWFHSGALWLMNEDTWRLPDNVFKLTFAEMLAKKEPGARSQEPEGDSGCCGCEADGGEEPKSGGQGSADRVPSTKYSVPSTNQASASIAPNPKSQIPNPQSPSSDARYDALEMTRPLSPEESLKAMHVRPGMKVELVAAEPLIVDPVAFDWGPDGRLWVVEMRDYPSGITWKKEGDEFGKPGGRVKVLTDVDGDGKYDKASVFLDEIPFPTGLKVWRKGILVTAAPEILYAEDKDGDDKADETKVLYRGFGEGNQQHRVNGLRWGLDNWLHVGNGDSGGIIKSLLTGAEINVNGRDLRIRPDTGELEATSGNTQFGRERDDWGNWFGNNNSDPLWHYTLDDHYLRRNPHLTPPSVKKQVSVMPGAAPVFPRSKTLTRFNDDNKANRYTSACGPTLYRDDLLGPEYYGNSFVCEPVHNLVSREIITPQGTTFTSKRADDEKQSEFLASEDNWFRPSMCRTGPDGALWVADMYRFVIEHPKWIPPAAQKKLDMRAGDDKGRIYRIFPADKQPRPIVRLDKLDTAGLVAALDSPNGTQRDLAHQMLIWRGDKEATGPLQRLAGGSKRPQTRLQAFCALEGLGVLTAEGPGIKLLDDHPAIVGHAIRLSEPWLGKDERLTEHVILWAFDNDLTIQKQAAYTLGTFSDIRAARALASLLMKNASDPYITAAALSSINKDNISTVLEKLLAAEPNQAEAGIERVIERVLTMAAAMGQDAVVGKAVASILRQGNRADGQMVAIAGASDALARRNVKLSTLLDDDARRALSERLAAARSRVLMASAAGSDMAMALSALSLLARGLDDQDEADVALLAGLLSPQKSPEIRSAAVAALVRTGRGETAELLLTGWAAHSPGLRNQILDALAGREAWSLALLEAVKSGQVPASQFDARRRQQFLAARSKSVREKAEKVLAGAVDSNRQKLVEAYLSSATSASGDVERGKTAFGKRCANCHRLEGAGHAVGPDLAPLTHKPAEYMLTAILDPNRAVEDRYVEYVALTTDGRQLTGILLEETGASLTLAAPEGKRVVLPRGELEQLKSSGKSLMPEGIERDVPAAEMTDILAYLRHTAPPPKQLALNQPEVVQPFNDGSIRLFASNCRAYGPTIKMEETYRALGWWNSQEDHCAWTFEVPVGSGGEYRVTLEYSCADNAAGNTVVVEAGGQSLTGTVASSGGWERFRGWNLGTVKLAEGRGELLVRSSGPIKGALFDLGGIRLVPVR